MPAGTRTTITDPDRMPGTTTGSIPRGNAALRSPASAHAPEQPVLDVATSQTIIIRGIPNGYARAYQGLTRGGTYRTFRLRAGCLGFLTEDVLEEESQPRRRFLFRENILYQCEDLGHGVQVENLGELLDVLCVAGPCGERLHREEMFR